LFGSIEPGGLRGGIHHHLTGVNAPMS